MIPVMRHIVEFNSTLTKFVCVDRARPAGAQFSEIE